MASWWRSLWTPSETPLKSLETDDLTAEYLLDRLHRLERLMSEYRLEWGDHLDKMNRLSGRMYALNKARRKKEEAEAEEEEEEQEGAQPILRVMEPRPSALPPYDPFNKESVRAHFSRRSNGL